MTTPSQYKLTGLQHILTYKNAFHPFIKSDGPDVEKFIDVFCEYQLADNNYMNIHFEAGANKDNESWFESLSLDQALQFITYIIWTDKFLIGYLNSKIADETMYRLLQRIESLHPELIFSAAGK